MTLPQAGAWARTRATVPARRPIAPHEAQNSRSSTGAMTGRASTTSSPPSARRWPVARRPRGPRPSRASGSIGSKRSPARARAVAFNMASGSSTRRWIVQRHPSCPPRAPTPRRLPPRAHHPAYTHKPEEPLNGQDQLSFMKALQVILDDMPVTPFVGDDESENEVHENEFWLTTLATLGSATFVRPTWV